MKKHLILSLIAAAALALPLLTGSPALGAGAEPVQLKERVVVTDNVVRLGDLFTNAGEKAEAAVAYAPEPGKQAVLDARWLYRVARAYKLDWKPLGIAAQAVVERDSVAIPHEEIKAEIIYALAAQGVTEDMDIEMSTRLQQIYVPAGGIPDVRVENIDYFERTGRFTAALSVTSNAGIERMRLTGRVFRTVDVPVLKDRVLRGDVIAERDVEWKKMNAARVQQDVIVDAQDLIGKSPRRGIRAGMPIRSGDVQDPVLVKKNSLVTIYHQVPNMTLTAQGKALEDGADGDVIRIRNERSNQVIEAEVVGSGRVAVRSLLQEISMNVN